MKILHIAQNSNGYEEVTLIANRISKKVRMPLIEIDGVKKMTGGFLINDTPEIRSILDGMDHDTQYEFMKSIKCDPYVKIYASDEDLK